MDNLSEYFHGQIFLLRIFKCIKNYLIYSKLKGLCVALPVQKWLFLSMNPISSKDRKNTNSMKISPCTNNEILQIGKLLCFKFSHPTFSDLFFSIWQSSKNFLGCIVRT